MPNRSNRGLNSTHGRTPHRDLFWGCFSAGRKFCSFALQYPRGVANRAGLCFVPVATGRMDVSRALVAFSELPRGRLQKLAVKGRLREVKWLRLRFSGRIVLVFDPAARRTDRYQTLPRVLR